MATQSGNEDWRKMYRPLIIAGTLAFVMTMFVAPITADGNAMEPTIRDGEVIVIQKKRFSENRGLPEYGDVLCFKRDLVEIEGANKGEQSVSRVVALPGDTVKVSVDGVYVNDKKLKDEPYADGNTSGKDMTITLGDDEVFVLGDNRQAAIDSRDERIGAVDLDEARGKCVFRIWPLDEIGRIK